MKKLMKVRAMSVSVYVPNRGRAMAQAETGSIRVGYVVDKVALAQYFLRVLRFSLSISFHRRSLCSYIIWGMNTYVSGSSSKT
jgi:hypothetical protein